MKTPSSLTKPYATTQALLVAAMTLLLASSSVAGINQFSIGLNSGSDGGNNPGTGSLNPGDVAGLPAVAQANWNNLGAVSGSLPNVTDNNGNATSAGVAWFSGTGTWSSGGNNAFVSTNGHTLMQGYLDNGGTATVTITNIPSQLTSGYDVYVYPLPGGVKWPHTSAHMKGTRPAGGNVGYLDTHVAWKKFEKMEVRTNPGATPSFWW
jgi:hypothetical protein